MYRYFTTDEASGANRARHLHGVRGGEVYGRVARAAERLVRLHLVDQGDVTPPIECRTHRIRPPEALRGLGIVFVREQDVASRITDHGD